MERETSRLSQKRGKAHDAIVITSWDWMNEWMKDRYRARRKRSNGSNYRLKTQLRKVEGHSSVAMFSKLCGIETPENDSELQTAAYVPLSNGFILWLMMIFGTKNANGPLFEQITKERLFNSQSLNVDNIATIYTNASKKPDPVI